MTTKYTPGPWVVNDQRGNGCMNNGVYILAGRNFVRVFNEFGDEANQEANARLIAAAPELLEALQALRVAATYSPILSAQVDAAIAKATGEVE